MSEIEMWGSITVFYLLIIVALILFYVFFSKISTKMPLVIGIVLTAGFFVLLVLSSSLWESPRCSSQNCASLINSSSASKSEAPLKVFSDIGQAFGILNTIFSGLAFWGVYLTLKTQKETLDHKKETSAIQTLKDDFTKLGTSEDHDSLLKVSSNITMIDHGLLTSLFFSNNEGVSDFLKENGYESHAHFDKLKEAVIDYIKPNINGCGLDKSFEEIIRSDLTEEQISKEDIGQLFDQYQKHPTVYWVSYSPLKLLFDKPLKTILEHENDTKTSYETAAKTSGKSTPEDIYGFYPQIIRYLNRVEIILTDYVDDKPYITKLERKFAVLQTTIPDEYLHIICYFAFFYHPYIKQTEGRLGKLIKKTSLLDELHSRVVFASENRCEDPLRFKFSPLHALLGSKK